MRDASYVHQSNAINARMAMSSIPTILAALSVMFQIACPAISLTSALNAQLILQLDSEEHASYAIYPIVTHVSLPTHAPNAFLPILHQLECAISAALVGALNAHQTTFVQLALQETQSIMEQLVLHAM